MFEAEPKWLAFQLKHEFNMKSVDNVIRTLNWHAFGTDPNQMKSMLVVNFSVNDEAEAPCVYDKG